jgi:hypothetical protein
MGPPVPRRRVFAFAGRRDPLMLLLLPFKAMLFAGPENLAAHRRSNLLSRSRGISHITKAPGLLSPPGLKTSTRALL